MEHRKSPTDTHGAVFSSWTRRAPCEEKSPLSSGGLTHTDSSDSPPVLAEDFPMIEVSIPSMEREVDESGKTRKVRTLFNLL